MRLIYQPYKWFIVVPFVFANTMILGLVCILTDLFLGRSRVNGVAVLWAKLCCAVVPLRIRVRGRRHYNAQTPYVVVANHQSMADIPALHASLGLNIKWVMKKELSDIPVFGQACSHLGCISVDRSDHNAAMRSIQSAKQQLPQNACVLFFAEGTRSRNKELGPFKKGAFRFAMDMNLPILPVTVQNSADILPSDSLDLTFGTVDIRVHPPIPPKSYHKIGLNRLMEQTRATISQGL